MTCHDVSAKKVGPAFKEIATKYKGWPMPRHARNEAHGAKGHPAVKASADDVKALVNGCWRDSQLPQCSKKSRRSRLSLLFARNGHSHHAGFRQICRLDFNV
jgi:hypothetical protein